MRSMIFDSLIKDGSERSDALLSDDVVPETASERHRMGNGEIESTGVSTGADKKGGGVLERTLGLGG